MVTLGSDRYAIGTAGNFAAINIAEGVAEIGLAEQRLLSLGVCNDGSLQRLVSLSSDSYRWKSWAS